MTKKTKKSNQGASKNEIFEAVLKQVPFDGWSQSSLDQAVETHDFSMGDLRLHFPNGIPDLLDYFGQWADEQLIEAIDKKALSEMRVRDRIAYLVRKRLEILTPYKESVRASLGAMAKPPRFLKMPRHIWRTASLMWYEAGDTATDYNHYSKRFLLSGVIKSTTLYWLNDTSDNHEKTWAFLERRIDDVLKFGQTIGQVKSVFAKLNPFAPSQEKHS